MNMNGKRTREMTTEKKNQSLAEYIRDRRESRKLDYYQAAERSGLDHTYWRKLEYGQYEAPSPKALKAIADALRVPLEDLYALAGYDLPTKLPAFPGYLRARYHLPHQAVAELERYFELLRHYYGIPSDRQVFPPKPRTGKRTAQAKRRVSPKRRAA